MNLEEEEELSKLVFFGLFFGRTEQRDGEEELVCALSWKKRVKLDIGRDLTYLCLYANKLGVSTNTQRRHILGFVSSSSFLKTLRRF